ncbi:hypothetical protein N0V86_000289 [Didymella sp. IMI 355093]|nr:hypothetical protein N0V86_000289 [Didymella sp. IMI 355093]
MTDDSADQLIAPRGKRMKFDNPVRILVGADEDARTFIIPAACLNSRSLFFKKALSGDWKEEG